MADPPPMGLAERKRAPDPAAQPPDVRPRHRLAHLVAVLLGEGAEDRGGADRARARVRVPRLQPQAMDDPRPVQPQPVAQPVAQGVAGDAQFLDDARAGRDQLDRGRGRPVRRAAGQQHFHDRLVVMPLDHPLRARRVGLLAKKRRVHARDQPVQQRLVARRHAHDAGVHPAGQFAARLHVVGLPHGLVEFKGIIELPRHQERVGVEWIEQRRQVAQDDQVGVEPGHVGVAQREKLQHQPRLHAPDAPRVAKRRHRDRHRVRRVPAQPLGQLGLVLQHADAEREVAALPLQRKREQLEPDPRLAPVFKGAVAFHLGQAAVALWVMCRSRPRAFSK